MLLDGIFGRECFLNEIIWAYDFGARPKRRWPAKHDTILMYVKNPRDYVFNADDIDRIPYMAPGLVGPEKAARGKLPTDVWWHTIVSPQAKRRPAIRRRNRSAFCGGSSRHLRIPAISCSISSLVAARAAQPPLSWDETFC